MARDRTIGLTSALARGVAKQGRQSQFYARRLADTRQVEERVNRGELAPEQGKQILRSKGYLPGGSAYKEPKGVGGFAAKTIGETAASFAYTPKGVWELGKLGRQDLVDPVNVRAGELPRTVQRAMQIGSSMAQDLRHPLRHPGYTLVDALSLGLAGAGLAAKASAASRTAGAARTAGRSVPSQVGRGAVKFVVTKPPKSLVAAAAVKNSRRGRREYQVESGQSRTSPRMQRSANFVMGMLGLPTSQEVAQRKAIYRKKPLP